MKDVANGWRVCVRAVLRLTVMCRSGPVPVDAEYMPAHGNTMYSFVAYVQNFHAMI